MPISPGKDEDQDKWMARCVPEMMGEHGGTKRPQDQAVAACAQMWRDAHPGGEPKPKQFDDDDDDEDEADVPEPDDDESHEDFMDRCTDELSEDMDDDAAENACQTAWENRSGSDGIKHKTHSETVQGMEFVLSDESIDRIGDTISAEGWQLDQFKRNPIALWSHRSDQPIGTWENLRIEDKQLRGRLKLAPKGTSARIDELRALIDAGILRAVSVGFRSIEDEPIDKQNPWGGMRFIKQELIECSLVSIPANANALAVAKSLRISPQTLDLVFAKHGNRNRLKRRGFTGKHADTSRNGKGSAMSLAQRIIDLETQIVAKRDELQDHLANSDDSNVSDADLEHRKTLNSDIARLERTHSTLIDSEKLLGKSADNGGGKTNGGSRALATIAPEAKARTAFAQPRRQSEQKIDVMQHLLRAAIIGLRARGSGMTIEATRQRIAENESPEYGEESTREAVELILRASSAPAMTTVTGWAAELVQQIYTDPMALLMPNSILPRLAAKGLALAFGRAGRIIIPTRSRTPTVAGSFVGEGMAIPVRQGAFTTQTLTPKKLGVITTWTKEMDDHSIPAIEGILREAVMVDTSVAIDTVLIDTNPATVIRPSGLLNGIAALTATAGGGLAALLGDLKLLIGALTQQTMGQVRTPAWLMNPGNVLNAALASAPNTGIFPFRDEIARGTLNTIPIIDSVTVPLNTMILVDAADFVVVGGEAPRLEISDQATLHMEDTNPTDLVSSGSPGVVAAPQRSLFQTDSLALRMVMPLNWVQRRAGTVVWTQNVTW